MFARSGLLLTCILAHFCYVVCASHHNLSTTDDAFDGEDDYNYSYYPLVEGDKMVECYNGLCKSFEMCSIEKDEDSGETFAMCKCGGETRCVHEGISVPASDFNALAAEKYALQLRRTVSSCSLKCLRNEECLPVMGTEICVPRRTCDKERKPCRNGGSCQYDENEGFACVCPQDFDGDLCEVNKTACSRLNPCENEGDCVVNENQSICECKPGWRGNSCEMPVDPCLSSPCSAGQSCVANWKSSGNHSYGCVTMKDPCLPNPCQGDCQCKASCKHEGGYFCHGSSGRLGKNCDIPAPMISCGADTITVSVDGRIVEEYSGGKTGFIMYMSHFHSISNFAGCTTNESAGLYNFSVPSPFTECGVIVTRNGDVTRVSGKIWLNRNIGEAEMAIPVVEFVCRYDKKFKVVTSLVPAQNIRRPKDQPSPDPFQNPGIYHEVLTGNGTLIESATMELCKTGEYCPKQCPERLSVQSRALYTVNERIHLRILPKTKKSQLRLTSLYLSCSSNATEASDDDIGLFAAGCISVSTRRSLKTQARNTGGSVCLSFRAPLLKKCQELYIHAHLEDCGPKCDPTYRSCNGRFRRSVAFDEDYVFGPIYIVDVHDGVLESVLYPGDDDVQEGIVQSKLGSPRPSALLIALVAICIGAIVTTSMLFSYKQFCRM